MRAVVVNHRYFMLLVIIIALVVVSPAYAEYNSTCGITHTWSHLSGEYGGVG